jgi:hypothetical protein
VRSVDVLSIGSIVAADDALLLKARHPKPQYSFAAIAAALCSALHSCRLRAVAAFTILSILSERWREALACSRLTALRWMRQLGQRLRLPAAPHGDRWARAAALTAYRDGLARADRHEDFLHAATDIADLLARYAAFHAGAAGRGGPVCCRLGSAAGRWPTPQSTVGRHAVAAAE